MMILIYMLLALVAVAPWVNSARATDLVRYLRGIPTLPDGSPNVRWFVKTVEDIWSLGFDVALQRIDGLVLGATQERKERYREVSSRYNRMVREVNEFLALHGSDEAVIEACQHWKFRELISSK